MTIFRLHQTTMSTYYTSLANYAAFSADDYTSVASAHQYTTVLTNLNALTTCAADTWVLYTGGSNCTGKTIWTVSDGETGGATSASTMCISVSTFRAAGYTASNRYSGGCISSSNIIVANGYVNNLYTFYTSANTLYTNMRSTLASASGSKYEGEALLTKFSTNLSNYQTINTDFATYYTYIAGFQNGSTDLKSCTIFRTDM